ncbi:MAG: hypothetical protein LBF97_08360 [Elusimicrobiota bacterium]|nr:hypothetical protein [Elusimicrobiota bacterium]
MNIFNINKIFILLLIIIFSFNNVFSYTKANDLTKKNLNSNLYRSILYPGLGQYYIGNKTKGVTFMAGTTFAILGAIYSYNRANSKYNDYKSLSYDNKDLYDDYSEKIDQMYMFIGAGILIWIFNIYDIYKDTKSLQKREGLNISLENKEAIISYSKTL